MSKRKNWISSVNSAIKDINRYQKGELVPLKTSLDHLNEISLGGLFPGDILTIAGKSGHGKSHTLRQIETSVFQLNPDQKIGLLRFNMEMSVRKLLLNSLRDGTGLPMSDILLKEPEDKALFKKIIDQERHSGIDHIEEAVTPEEFEEECLSFIEDNKDKDYLLITIDHIVLIKAGKGGKKDAVDLVMEKCINIRQKNPKVIFIVLSQLNREINDRTNPKDMAPRTSDLFQSSTMEFASDIILVSHMPSKMGYDSYLSLSKKKYDYLSPYCLSSKGASKFMALDPEDTVFHHYIKVRTPDRNNYRDIFAQRLSSPPIEIVNKMPEELYIRQDISAIGLNHIKDNY